MFTCERQLGTEYLKRVIKETEEKNTYENEFIQALKEVLSSLEPVILKNKSGDSVSSIFTYIFSRSI